ncbi:MAG: nucleotidyl transferase AbiEii/AbiGii toxin family protein [Candidatus Omnitrophica bacterium]|nr:nucleotidyl transferase AbiEii/AbiGii toxin family protein [Candidatus Omnitrophota bacterium]
MSILKEHEKFEMEVLEKMSSAKLLEPLVFGGGTMLRLCYELNRYSTDLNFWIIKEIDESKYFKKCKDYLKSIYEITYSQNKHYTLLFELRSENYPKRLKIEIRKGISECEFTQRIAFSPFTNKQIFLKVHTLNQTMANKIAAAIDRKNIRDVYDIEFITKRGIGLPTDNQQLAELKKIILGFKDRDYKVTLGSILEAKERKYYIEKKFDFLMEKLG